MKITGILKSGQLADLLLRLGKIRDVDLLSAPKVLTQTNQDAKIEIPRDSIYPVEFEKNASASSGISPKTFETRAIGVELLVRIVPHTDEQVLLRLTASSSTEFDGFLNKPLDASETPEGFQQPVFSTRQLQTIVTMQSDDTVVLVHTAAPSLPVTKPGTEEKVLLLLVTLRKAERPLPGSVNPEPTPKPQAVEKVAGELPSGLPVSDHPGYIRSPFAPDSGLVDVRGFKSGTEIKCPYSGKTFLVP